MRKSTKAGVLSLSNIKAIEKAENYYTLLLEISAGCARGRTTIIVSRSTLPPPDAARVVSSVGGAR